MTECEKGIKIKTKTKFFAQRRKIQIYKFWNFIINEIIIFPKKGEHIEQCEYYSRKLVHYIPFYPTSIFYV